VFDSNAADEYEEIRRKFAGTRKALTPFMETDMESPA
jgi:anthranilate synthase component 1